MKKTIIYSLGLVGTMALVSCNSLLEENTDSFPSASVIYSNDKGVEAALLAPTAVNQQKFSFEYAGIENNRHKVIAKKGFSLIGYTHMDLGIAKYHFEIAAGKENFDWK